MPKHTKKIITVAACLVSIHLYARTHILPSGARSLSLGKAMVAVHQPGALTHNPAGLASIPKTTFVLDYENRFLIPELSLAGFSATVPFAPGNISIALSSFGPSAWQEMTAGLSMSRFFGDKFSSGLTLRYFGQKLPESGKIASAFGFDLGCIVQITNHSQLGLSLLNPLSSSMAYASRKEKIPYAIRIGGSTSYQKILVLLWEIEKEQHQPLLLKTGLEWKIADQFFLRMGFDSLPRFSSGFGFDMGQLRVDVAFGYHQYLGYSPSVTLQYELK
jgi:hypothetical protein